MFVWWVPPTLQQHSPGGPPCLLGPWARLEEITHTTTSWQQQKRRIIITTSGSKREKKCMYVWVLKNTTKKLTPNLHIVVSVLSPTNPKCQDDSDWCSCTELLLRHWETQHRGDLPAVICYTWSMFYYQKLTVVGAWRSNTSHRFLWDVVIHPCPSFNANCHRS